MGRPPTRSERPGQGIKRDYFCDSVTIYKVKQNGAQNIFIISQNHFIWKIGIPVFLKLKSFRIQDEKEKK
jgi:hypothetical protein